jgi:hypothetical protein
MVGAPPFRMRSTCATEDVVEVVVVVVVVVAGAGDGLRQ